MLLYTISTQLVLNGFEKNILCSCRLLLAAAARLGAARLQLNPIQYTGRRPHWRLSWHTTMPGIAYHHARNSLSKKGSLVAERTASRTLALRGHSPVWTPRLLVAAPKRRFLHFRADMHCLRGSGREELKDTILNLAMISSEAR